MEEKFQFTPFNELMFPLLKDLNPVQVFEWEGKDISDIADFDLGGEECFVRLYKSDKIEKICYSKVNLYGGMVAGGVTITPADNYDLPSFVSDWDEAEDHIHAIVDYIPADDCGRDMEYLINYFYKPLENLYKKYCEIPGLKNNIFYWVRAFQSPYMITGIIKQDPARANARQMVSCAQDYLKAWVEMWKEAKPIDPDSERGRLVRARRSNIRNAYRHNDPGEGPLRKILGAEKARKILDALMP